MSKQTVLLLHGFLSSAGSTKARYFGEKFQACPQVSFHAFDFNPTPLDFEYMTITGMIDRLRQYVLDRDLASKDVRLVGSSLGGLVGLNYAHRFGHVAKLLLLAPAVAYRSHLFDAHARQAWQQAGTRSLRHYGFKRELPLRYGFDVDSQRYQAPVPPAAPTLIVHGIDDDVVPIAHSRAYVTAHPERARLIEVASDHMLHDQLDLIWKQVDDFLLA